MTKNYNFKRNELRNFLLKIFKEKYEIFDNSPDLKFNN